jgi:HEAT repeat protein
MRFRPRFGAPVLALGVATALFSAAVLVARKPPDPPFEGRLASHWALDLLSSDYSTRSDAQAALASLGEAATPQLRVLLRKNNGPAQKWLAQANRWLPFLHHTSRDAVLCRQRAAEMAGLLGPKARAAAPELLNTLAMDACAADAERALVRIGPAALPEMNRALRSRKSVVRARTAKILREFSGLPDTSVEALLRASADAEPAVRRQVASTLGALAGEGRKEAAGPALLKLANDAAPEVRAAAVESLGRTPDGAGLPEVEEAVRWALHDPDVSVRLQAAKAVWNLKRDSAAILPVLTGILPTGESWQAAYALAQMGSAAAPAVPGLVEALQRERVPRPYRTPPSSAFALGQIGAAAIPALAPLLKAADARTRLNAVMAIGFMGRGGNAAVPDLLPLLRDKNAEVRNVAALTLAGIGAEREQVLDGLSACLSAEDIYMRSAAAQVLREIAPEGNWVVSPE